MGIYLTLRQLVASEDSEPSFSGASHLDAEASMDALHHEALFFLLLCS